MLEEKARREKTARIKSARAEIVGSHQRFIKEFYPLAEGEDFLFPKHSRVMCDVIDGIVEKKYGRVLVTVPPGYIKTMVFAIMLMARGFAINPRSRFVHATYSADLALDNSNSTRNIIKLDEYQEMFGVSVDGRVDGKGLWKTSEGGGVKAAAAGGQITGFRAGRLSKSFNGALILDDPLKPIDAFTVKRQQVNDNWHRTLKSRLADENVPVICIMQRLHREDFAGFLLSGGADGQIWDHLFLPVMIDRSQPYPAEFTHGRPIPHDIPDGPLWSQKHDIEDIDQLRAEPYTFASQYMQRPTALGGSLFREEHISRRWSEIPSMKARYVFADTAQKIGEKNDYSVFQLWGEGIDGNAYLIDQVRGKWEADQLLAVAEQFWKRHRRTDHPSEGVLRSFNIEDKSSGTGLIQQLGARQIPVQGIQRGRGQDKRSRALDVIPIFAVNRVILPDQAPWLAEYISELLGFDGEGNAHDDQVDPTMDAVAKICGSGGSIFDQVR